MKHKDDPEGILLVNKPYGWTSFQLVKLLRRILQVKKIGHAGTLDPLATGVMIMLIGRNYTRLSDQYLTCDKKYLATIKLGEQTDTYDAEGKIINTSTIAPTNTDIEDVIKHFQKTILQKVPMYSAKKIGGTALYKLARQGKEVDREPIEVTVSTHLVKYSYPILTLEITCSKGTYIRSIADDIGLELGCYAYLKNLIRLKSGNYHIDECIDGLALKDPNTTKEFLETKLICKSLKH